MQAGMLLALVLTLPPLVAAPQPDVKKIGRIEAIQVGVTRNYELLAKGLEKRRLEILGRAAWKPYSPSVYVDPQYRHSLLGQNLVDYSAGADWKSVVGTTLSAVASVNHDLLPGLPSPLTNELSLTLSQPLLKDAWLQGAALPLREAELQSLVQKEIYRGEINALISNIETAYWDLALAESDLKIKTRSRDRARQQFEDTAENIRRGIIADVEIYIVEENVVFFEQELLRTDQALRLAQRRLAELLALEPDALLAADDALTRPALVLPARVATVELGLRESPTITAQLRRTELSAARFGYAANQALPALNVHAQLSVLRYPEPSASVGVRLTVPLDRGAISATVESARIDNERQQIELQNLQAKVRFELENALTELELNLRLLSLATKRIELAELKLGAQNDKYKNGISTLADVVRFQRELDDALIASQRVIRAVHVGHTRLLQTQGTLAQTVGVGLK